MLKEGIYFIYSYRYIDICTHTPTHIYAYITRTPNLISDNSKSELEHPY